MSQPYAKFSVGEDVLVYSVLQPEIHGAEATVTFRTYGKGRCIDGSAFEGWAYIVEPDPTPAHVDKGSGWMEQSLRKRPSDYDFKELIESLKKSRPKNPWLEEPKEKEKIDAG